MIAVASRRSSVVSQRVLDSLYFRQRRPKTKLQKWAVQEGKNTTKSTCKGKGTKRGNASKVQERKGRKT